MATIGPCSAEVSDLLFQWTFGFQAAADDQQPLSARILSRRLSQSGGAVSVASVVPSASTEEALELAAQVTAFQGANIV